MLKTAGKYLTEEIKYEAAEMFNVQFKLESKARITPREEDKNLLIFSIETAIS